MAMLGRTSFCILALFCLALQSAEAVKEIFAHKEFTSLLKDAGARPVIIDFYSQSCGPCHMIAPIYRKISKEFAGKAFFRKVDVNRNSQTSQSQGIRSMPTFQFWVKGKKVHQFSGADEHALREWTKKLVDQADKEDVEVSSEALMAYYKKHDPSKATEANIAKVIEKNSKDFGTMVRLLKKKYGEAPKTSPRKIKAKPAAPGGGAGSSKGFSLETVNLEELKQELERREEDAAMDGVEEEEKRLANNPCSLYRNRTEGATEKVVIIGGGPSGMTAAIYAARANLCPLLIAPALGGQLLAKGVDVENYPGLPRENGGKMIQIMKKQARSFFTEVRDDYVLSVNVSKKPFEIVTNNSGSPQLIKTHTLIIATGADSRWLGTEGEWEYRGYGVSSCAACDGYLFKGRPCAVVGGGDTAMEEALMLSRICSSVDLLHRRNEFRASLVMQQRVLNNPQIRVRWNTAIDRFEGKTEEVDGEQRKSLTNLRLKDTQSKEISYLPVEATFIAIGHDPNTKVLKTQVDMDGNDYLIVQERSTRTSVPGVFAAGDVADHTYRQAITSAGSGAQAALDAERYLSEVDIETDSTCVRQEDFSTWSLPELQAQVKLLGIKCNACSEKSDFVASLRASY